MTLVLTKDTTPSQLVEFLKLAEGDKDRDIIISQNVDGYILLSAKSLEYLTKSPLTLTIGRAQRLFDLAHPNNQQPSQQDPNILQDSTLPDRNDPKWHYLRSLVELEKKIDQSIELPDIGGKEGSYAKEMNANKVKSLFLTPPRFELAKKFFEILNIGSANTPNADTQSGIILSGPNGCGKTFENYLLTCIAYANNGIVVYIPRTQDWAALKTEDEYASYFLRRFLAFNAVAASHLQCQVVPNKWNVTTLFNLACRGLGGDSYQVFTALMKELSLVILHPILYSIDEHNEIWKLKKDKENFFRPFMTSTGSCAGRRTFLLISGSSHSQFEHNLQPGLERWLHYIKPLPLTSFEIAIQSGGFCIASKWRADNTAVLLLSRITGRLPREIYRFQQTNLDPMSFAVNRKDDHFRGEIEKFVNSHPNNQRYLEFLRLFFSRKSNIKSNSPGSFIDTGLLYYDDVTHVYHSVCYGAFLALFDYYYGTDALLRPINSYPTQAEKGYAFERWIIHRLKEGRLVQSETLESIVEANDSFSQIQFPPILQPIYIDHNNIPENQTTLATMYIPSEENFPYWDLVIHNPRSTTNQTEQIIFIQISISDLHSHDRDTYQIARSFGYSKKKEEFIVDQGVSTVERIIKSITGKDCTSIFHDDSTLKVEFGAPSSQSSEDTDMFDPPEVLFFYITATDKETMQRYRSIRYHNLYVLHQDTYQHLLNISFN